MLDVLIWVGVFCASIFFVVKSADWFSHGAERLALSLGISPWVIGITLVAVGTSLPELFTSLASVFAGKVELVADNIVGSNIANILLIIGLSAIIARKLAVERDLIDLDLPLLVGSQVVLFFVLLDGSVNRIEGALSLIVFFIYIMYAAQVHKGEEVEKLKKDNLWKLSGIIVSSLAVLIVSSKFTIDSVIKLSDLFGISSSLIGITALAVGTSLPELMVSIMSAKRGAYELSLGNIIGSNIFNGAGIIGIVSLVRPLVVSAEIMSVGLSFLVAATFMCVISGISRRIHIWEGLMFLMVYVVFLAKLFGLF
jgi:cation:H+ antiporter